MRKNIVTLTLTVLLILATFACTRSSKVVVNYPVFLHNDAAQIERFAERVKREKNTLLLRLKSGVFTQLHDLPSCEDFNSCLLYRFEDYFPETGFYLIKISYYEGGEYILLSETNGTQTIIHARPHFSPDLKHFATVSADDSGYNENGVFLWRIDSGKVIPEFSYKPLEAQTKEYALFEFARWNNNELLLNKYVRADKAICKDSRLMHHPVTLHLDNNAWVFRKNSLEIPPKCTNSNP